MIGKLNEKKLKEKDYREFGISISLLVKSINRNYRTAFLYTVYRLKKIKFIYWFDVHFFSQRILKDYITKAEIKFLKSYHKLVYDFSRKVGIDLCENLTSQIKPFFTTFEITRGFSLVKGKINFFTFSKFSKYSLPSAKISKLKNNPFFFDTSF